MVLFYLKGNNNKQSRDPLLMREKDRPHKADEKINFSREYFFNTCQKSLNIHNLCNVITFNHGNITIVNKYYFKETGNSQNFKRKLVKLAILDIKFQINFQYNFM